MALSTFLKSSKNVFQPILLVKRSLQTQIVKPYNVLQKTFTSKCPSVILLRCNSMYGSKRYTKLMKKDGIPEDFELVYRNPSTNFINLAQIASLVVGTSLLGFLLFTSDNTNEDQTERFGPQTKGEAIMAYSVLLLTCAGIQYIAHKSPIRLYTDGKKFIMVRHSILGSVGPAKKTEFLAGECQKAPFSYFTVFNQIRYTINGTAYMIFETHFRTNADYHLLMGSR